MQTVGKVLQQARKRKKISIIRLSQKTKIKEQFLRAIENEEWKLLPNFATTAGFVRNFAATVGTNPEVAAALLRRDFEEAKEKHQKKTFNIFWTPQTTLILVSLLALLLLGFYLLYQYTTFYASPPLNITELKRNNDSVTIAGSTRSEAQILIGGEPLLVNKDGKFEIKITAKTGDVITIESRARSGKSTKKEVTLP